MERVQFDESTGIPCEALIAGLWEHREGGVLGGVPSTPALPRIGPQPVGSELTGTRVETLLGLEHSEGSPLAHEAEKCTQSVACRQSWPLSTRPGLRPGERHRRGMCGTRMVAAAPASSLSHPDIPCRVADTITPGLSRPHKV